MSTRRGRPGHLRRQPGRRSDGGETRTGIAANRRYRGAGCGGRPALLRRKRPWTAPTGGTTSVSCTGTGRCATAGRASASSAATSARRSTPQSSTGRSPAASATSIPATPPFPAAAVSLRTADPAAGRWRVSWADNRRCRRVPTTGGRVEGDILAVGALVRVRCAWADITPASATCPRPSPPTAAPPGRPTGRRASPASRSRRRRARLRSGRTIAVPRS